MSSSEVMNEILQYIQNSNLNFNINLTPFSAYITIRNSFNRNFIQASSDPKAVETVSKEQLKQNILLDEKVKQLLKEIEDLHAHEKASNNTIKILEKKVSEAEITTYRILEEKNLETANLKLQ